MSTVILSSGKTFNAEWAAQAFDTLWSAKILGSDIVEIVTAFPDNDWILVKEDGMPDVTYAGFKYIDTVRVTSDGAIQITMRKET